MNALEQIAARAAGDRKRIVLPEGGDERVARAAGEVAERGLAEVILIGGAEVAERAGRRGGERLRVVDSGAEQCAEQYADVLMGTRKGRGMSRARALAHVRDPLTLGVCMVACGDADGCVAGAVNTTAEVLRAALQVVGVKEPGGAEKTAEKTTEKAAKNGAKTGIKTGLVSSFFIMQHDRPHQALRGPAVFADCAMVVDPDAGQLARIAMDTSDSAAALLRIKPTVALLSFSTAGSAAHPYVTKVREAGEIVARRRPDLELMAEVQFDAAVVPEILRRKAPGIKARAPANIFIFPDLQSANIGYKIAERIGAATAVGPILQGLKRPVNDLSRGCAVDDIIALAAVTAVQAQRL